MIATVADLIAVLSTMPADAKVKGLWDITLFDVHHVVLADDTVVIDVGDGPDGDWDAMKDALKDDITQI